MSPAEQATLADLARLAVEIRHDVESMGRCSADARATRTALERGDADRAVLIVGAVGLHGWYTGLETVLERVARVIDGHVPAGPTSHRDLLSQAMTDLVELRPAVVPRALEPDLLALLSFRHFFRHAYGVELDVARLRAELDREARLEPTVAHALDAFVRFLDASRARVGQP